MGVLSLGIFNHLIHHQVQFSVIHMIKDPARNNHSPLNRGADTFVPAGIRGNRRQKRYCLIIICGPVQGGIKMPHKKWTAFPGRSTRLSRDQIFVILEFSFHLWGRAPVAHFVKSPHLIFPLSLCIKKHDWRIPWVRPSIVKDFTINKNPLHKSRLPVISVQKRIVKSQPLLHRHFGCPDPEGPISCVFMVVFKTDLIKPDKHGISDTPATV